jgi:hypothetical protein
MMSTRCPGAQELTKLLDGELTENRAGELRAHVNGCVACAAELAAQGRLVSRIAAPIPGVPSESALSEVMRRLDEVGEAQGRSRMVSHVAWALSGLAVVVSLALMVVVRPLDEARERREFAARGATVDWKRKVGVELWALESAPRRISSGDRLSPGVALVGSFSNVESSTAYLLAFALDTRGEVHWLYPAYLDRRSDPPSIRLDASIVHRALEESVILEDVPPGPLRFVFVVTAEPLRVSDVESVGAADRTPAALRARWPAARVDELNVSVGAPSPSTP